MNLMRAVLAASIFVLGTGVGVAQLLPSQEGAEKPAAQPRTTRTVTPGPASSAPACVDILMQVGTTDAEGDEWDPHKTRFPPDFRISEATTGATGKCNDTFVCSIRITPVGNKLDFTIKDADWPDKDDLIGTGTCTAGRNCTVGFAKLTMSPC